MTCYWLSRIYRSPADFRLALLVDGLRWPETDVPRTDHPLDVVGSPAQVPTPRNRTPNTPLGATR